MVTDIAMSLCAISRLILHNSRQFRANHRQFKMLARSQMRGAGAVRPAARRAPVVCSRSRAAPSVQVRAEISYVMVSHCNGIGRQCAAGHASAMCGPGGGHRR